MSDVSITELKNAVATLLPCLRSQNYRERWDDRSPAVRALQALSAFVGEEVPTAGDLMDPEVATVHAKPPEAVTVPSEPSDSALWDFANDLLAAWNIEDTNEPSLTEQLRDMFVARLRLPVPVEPEWEYSTQNRAKRVEMVRRPLKLVPAGDWELFEPVQVDPQPHAPTQVTEGGTQ